MPPLSFQSALRRHRMKHLVEAQRRPKTFDAVRGFIVNFSDSLILLHCLEEDMFRLNGFTAIRRKDVSAVRFFDSSTEWQYRAVRRFHLSPRKQAGIDVASLGDLLTSAGRAYPLIAIYTETRRPDVCFIGEVACVTDATLKLEDLNSNAEWCRPRRIKLADVTRVDFGSGYEQALAASAPKRRKGKSRFPLIGASTKLR